MFALRPYQQKVVNDTYNCIRQGEKRILIFAPTGAGKTIIITKIVADAVSRGKKVLFVVHREILITQTAEKFSNIDSKCGFIKAGWSEDTNALIQIASVQTLASRQKWKNLNFDLIIFDECHLVAFNKVSRLMMRAVFPDAIYIGLTATPWRLSKNESLGDIYSALVCAPMPKTLIELGFLVKPSYYGLNFNVELDEVDLVNGDYDLNQLSAICDRPELIEQLCNSWLELAYGRSTIIFAIKVSHAENIARVFNERDIPSAVVSGNTPIALRNKLYQQLVDGVLLALVSCNALSEGFDVPQVSCVVLDRRTKSKALYFQQVGRGLRLAEKKNDCVILDQAGNVLEHGFIEDLEEVTLEATPEKNSDRSIDKIPLKICPLELGGCGAYVATGVLKCPHCQYDFDLAKLITILGCDRLISYGDRIKMEKYRCLLRESYQNNFAPSWAAVKFRDEFGFFPPFDWARGAIFDGENGAVAIYTNYLKRIAKRLNKDQDWVQQYFCMEFGFVLS